MAIKKPDTAASGAPSPEAFHRIQRFEYRQIEDSLTIEVYSYHDAAAAAAGKPPIHQTPAVYTLRGAELTTVLNAPLDDSEAAVQQPPNPPNPQTGRRSPRDIMLTRMYRFLIQTERFSGGTTV